MQCPCGPVAGVFGGDCCFLHPDPVNPRFDEHLDGLMVDLANLAG